jgi:hypothetical protein
MSQIPNFQSHETVRLIVKEPTDGGAQGAGCLAATGQFPPHILFLAEGHLKKNG